MPPNPLVQQIINFAAEFLQRLRTTKPKFFVYCQYAVALMGTATGLPALIEKVNSVGGFHIVLSNAFLLFENKFIAACSAGFWLASQLTTASKVTAIKDGTVLKATDSDKLPFTANVECQHATSAGVPEVKEAK